jgi:hypothetical protein
MTKLIIPLLNGENWEVYGKVIGDLAIHPDKKEPARWSVTHVPSGLTFVKAVPKDVLRSKLKLTKWCEAVQLELKGDWKALRSVTAQSVLSAPQLSKELRERIRAHCLSTKV